MNKDIQESVNSLTLRNAALQEELDALKRQVSASLSPSPSSSSSKHGEGHLNGDTSAIASSSMPISHGKSWDHAEVEFTDDEEKGLQLTHRISMRKELANIFNKYELLQSQHLALSKKFSLSADRLKRFKGTYNDLRRHCYLIEEDKKALLEHTKWQDGQIGVLQRDIQELHTCNINSQIVIEDLKKENTILQISATERTLVANADLQAKYEALEKRKDVQNRQRDEACGVILELRSKLKQLEKKYDRVRRENTELKDISTRQFIDIQREQMAIQNQLRDSEQQHFKQKSTSTENETHRRNDGAVLNDDIGGTYVNNSFISKLRGSDESERFKFEKS